jgi:hypothetical protein
MSLNGVAAICVSNIDGNIILVGASYHNEGWETKSPVYILDKDNQAFHLVQSIPTVGAHDVDNFYYKGNHFLIFSEDRNSKTSRIQSGVYVWSSSSKQFEMIQYIETDGAHGAEFFEFYGDLFICVANFGDRERKRYKAVSTIWKLEENCNGAGAGSGGGGEDSESCTYSVAREFKKIAEIDTFGATDCEVR